MPIRPLSVNPYTEIIDEEDVSPPKAAETCSRKRMRRSVLLLAMLLVCLRVAMFMIPQHSNENSSVSIRLFETSLVEKRYDQQVSNEKLRKEDADIRLHIGMFKVRRLVAGILKVNRSLTYQTITGFGGAITEASAFNFVKLPSQIQQMILKEHLQYLEILRISINSCDFSLGSYSYDDYIHDLNLKHFNIDRDLLYIIPVIQQIIESKPNNNVKIIATPWSPPAWMKVPLGGKQSMLNSATPNGLILNHDVMTSWAQYFIQFISSYQLQNITIWAITPQNEPEFAAPWEACVYNMSTESYFIQNYLGPLLKEHYPNVLLIGFDHNKDHVLSWTQTLLDNDKQKGYIDGLAFHWYTGDANRMLDGTYGYNTLYESIRYAEVISSTSTAAAEKLFISTESSSCPGVKLHNYLRAERLAHDIIYDMIHGAHGYVDWNVLLNHEGGPNHLENYCDANMIINEQYDTVTYQPRYYYFQHFIKYIAAGSVRIDAVITGDYDYQIINPNIQSGIEVGMFNCEHSTRQLWVFKDNTIQLKHNVIEESEDLNEYNNANNDSSNDMTRVFLCLAEGTESRPYIRLYYCNNNNINNENNDARMLNISTIDIDTSLRRGNSNDNSNNMLTKIVRLKDQNTGLCIEVEQTFNNNDDIYHNQGILLALQPCVLAISYEHDIIKNDYKTDVQEAGKVMYNNNNNMISEDSNEEERKEDVYIKDHPQNPQIQHLIHQSFLYDDNTGEITFPYKDSVLCLTAGWPFLSTVGFQTDTNNDMYESESTVIIVSNEASISTRILLDDAISHDLFGFLISPRSLQTLIY